MTGFDAPVDTGAILEKRIALQGIYVGSVATLRALTQFWLAPQVDRVFAFEEAEEVYASLRRVDHFGKLVVRVGQ